VLLVVATAFARCFGDDTYVYSVRLSATVQASPPKITLSWPLDPYPANSFTVRRKLKGDTAWGSATGLLASTSSYIDTNISVGTIYEYQVLGPHQMPGLTNVASGYICSGINAPLVDNRGKVILVVATNASSTLGNELTRLQSDLAGEGWLVIRHNVSSNDTPASVRNQIITDYNADPANVNTVFLFGHVPTLQSGQLNYDGHLVRAMPADSYYGDVNGNWSSLPDYLPSDVELMVGRVDLFNMPGNGAPGTWPNETELLRNYLNKDHAWRHKQFTVPRRALIGDLRGVEEGNEATATSGYRNAEPLVGPGNTFNSAVTNGTPANARWSSILSANAYLLAYGCGAGQPDACSGLGTSDGDFADVRSADVFAGDLKAPFVMMFGSWFGQWDVTDDLLRSFLATSSMGLTACLAGRPHWYVHHLGMGETWGYSTRLSMNNSGVLYTETTNILNRAIYVSLMGDPTLRLDPVGPPVNLVATPGNGSVALSWAGSGDSVLGYHIYRSTSSAGPFTRLTISLVSGNAYTDPNVPNGSYTYMVRAVKLQTTPSGTYYNPSQGIFVSTSVTSITTPPITVFASRIGTNLQLNWNSASGLTYRVQARTNSLQGNWSDVSSTLSATGAVTTWTDTTVGASAQRFYRVMSP